jgi:hypothetical protein
MHVDMTIARIARIARKGCRALRAILKTLGILMVRAALHGAFRAMPRAMVEKLQSFLDCTIARHNPHTLVGVNRLRATERLSPRPVDVARVFLASWRIG